MALVSKTFPSLGPGGPCRRGRLRRFGGGDGRHDRGAVVGRGAQVRGEAVGGAAHGLVELLVFKLLVKVAEQVVGSEGVQRPPHEQ